MPSGITVDALAARIDELTSRIDKLEKALADSEAALQRQGQAIAGRIEDVTDTLNDFNLSNLDPSLVEWVPVGFVAKVDIALDQLKKLSEWAGNDNPEAASFRYISPGVAAELARIGKGGI
jgi:hypothetical protein